jgi:bile salt-stimulated lipase
MQSGVSINPWAFQTNPLNQASRFAQKLGISWSSTQDLVSRLRNVPASQLVDALDTWGDSMIPRGSFPFEFSPCVEPANSPEARFLTDTPTNILSRGQIPSIPLMFGYTDVEALFYVHEPALDPTIFNQFAANPHFYVPQSFNLHPTTNAAEVNEVATTFRNMYFLGGHPVVQNVHNYSIFMSDQIYNFAIDRAVRYHTRRQTQPVYYYRFSLDGAFNLKKSILQLTSFPGAVHGDVSCNFFSIAG